MYAPAEWADTLTLFHLYQYVYSVFRVIDAHLWIFVRLRVNPERQLESLKNLRPLYNYKVVWICYLHDSCQWETMGNIGDIKYCVPHNFPFRQSSEYNSITTAFPKRGNTVKKLISWFCFDKNKESAHDTRNLQKHIFLYPSTKILLLFRTCEFALLLRSCCNFSCS